MILLFALAAHCQLIIPCDTCTSEDFQLTSKTLGLKRLSENRPTTGPTNQLLSLHRQKKSREVLKMFWSHQWPPSTLPLFAENMKRAIQRAQTLEQREQWIERLQAQSENFKQLEDWSRTLTPQEFQTVHQPKTFQFRAPELATVHLNHEQVFPPLEIPTGLHRIEVRSDHHEPIILVRDFQKNLELKHDSSALVTGRCLEPQLNKRLDRINGELAIYFNKNCIYRRDHGAWTLDQTPLQIKSNAPHRASPPPDWWWYVVAFSLGLMI